MHELTEPEISELAERLLGGDAGVTDYWAPGEGVRLTPAGNLSLSEIRQIASGLRKSGKYGEVFVGVPRGHANAPFGIWARPKTTGRRNRGGIKPLLIRIKSPHYSRRFDFYGFAHKHAARIFDEEFRRAWRDAVRKVKPITKDLKRIWSNR